MAYPDTESPLHWMMDPLAFGIVRVRLVLHLRCSTGSPSRRVAPSLPLTIPMMNFPHPLVHAAPSLYLTSLSSPCLRTHLCKGNGVDAVCHRVKACRVDCGAAATRGEIPKARTNDGGLGRVQRKIGCLRTDGWCRWGWRWRWHRAGNRGSTKGSKLESTLAVPAQRGSLVPATGCRCLARAPRPREAMVGVFPRVVSHVERAIYCCRGRCSVRYCIVESAAGVEWGRCSRVNNSGSVREGP